MNNHREVIAASPDAIALALGTRIAGLHPLAAELSRSPLRNLARACGMLKQTNPDEPEIAVLARGMATADFSKALTDGTRLGVRRRFDKQAQHRAFASEVEVKDFRPTAAVNIDAGLDLGEQVSPNDEFTRGGAASYDGNDLVIYTYGKIFQFSRQLIFNDNVGAIGDVLANAGAAAARTEARLVAEALESDAPMADGGLPFHASYGNRVAAAFGEVPLAQSMACLRLQATPAGNFADFPAAHLVVAADIEFSARKLVHESGIGLVVSAMAGLPSGRWYLTADPSQAQTICVTRLKGSTSPVLVEMIAKQDFEIDGTAIRLRADLGAALISRTGIIRGGA